MKVNWETKTGATRNLVLEFETAKEHREFHKGGSHKVVTSHIHAGENNMKHGGMNIFLINGILSDPEEASVMMNRKKILSMLEEYESAENPFGAEDKPSWRLTDDLSTALSITPDGKLQVGLSSDVFSARFEKELTLEESTYMINKWLEKVSKLKDEMKLLSR